jgi:hypothetical protein
MFAIEVLVPQNSRCYNIDIGIFGKFHDRSQGTEYSLRLFRGKTTICYFRSQAIAELDKIGMVVAQVAWKPNRL